MRYLLSLIALVACATLGHAQSMTVETCGSASGYAAGTNNRMTVDVNGNTCVTGGTGGGGGGGDASAANQIVVQAVPGSDATKGVAVQGVTGGKAVPVSGTFWQATQPVSAAALPLPTGAATESTLSAASAKLPSSVGAKTGALSLSVVPNTDTAFPISAAALPLPSGAATSAKQDNIVTALGTPFQAGGSIGNTTFAATQSGTWNLTNISGTVSLPTGAATAAKQPALGTAGSASTDVITVQGITSGTPLIIGGNVASAATDSGNPTKVGAKYNSTLPTFTDGQRGDLQIGTRGSLHVELWTTDASSPVATASNAADALGTSVVGVTVNSRGYIFNGTTTDRIRSAVNAANTTGTGITAVGDMGQCDDTSPTAITENQFGNLRINCTTRAVMTEAVPGGNSFCHISTATTTTCKSGAGMMHTLSVNNLGTVASVTTVYDNTAGSGTVIASINTLAGQTSYIYDVTFATGLTLVTTGTVAPDITVSYR